MNLERFVEINRLRADKRKNIDKSNPNPRRKVYKSAKNEHTKKIIKAKYDRRYYEKNRDKILTQNKEKYYTNKKEYQERHQKTYIYKKEGWTKPQTEEERLERIKESKKAYEIRNRGKRITKVKKWRERNKVHDN